MATIKDVAQKAGVSIATVSYVINQDQRIKKETANKVKAACEELNYVASGIARSLKKCKTNNILVFVSSFGGPIYQEILATIHSTLKEKGYRMIVCNGELADSLLLERQADGAIVLDNEVSPELLERIAKNGFPIVDRRKVFSSNHIITRQLDGITPVYEVIKLAIAEGITEFGYMHGSLDSVDDANRYAGFTKALAEHGLVVSCVLHGEFREDTSYQALVKYVAGQNTLPRLLFCANDEMAIGAIRFCHDQAVQIPDDMKIIGFDNIELGNYVTPQLTTIDINRAEWSRNLALSIIEMLQGKESAIIEYLPQYQIIRRGSF